MRPPTLRPHIGIGLSEDKLVAALPHGRRLETGEVGDLRSAFAALRDATHLSHATVSVALLPPLVQVRHIQLPPLRESERRGVLDRDLGRYFLGLREPHLVGSVVLPRKTPPTSVFVAAARTRLVEELEAAVEAAGWMIAAIVPAHSAWAATRDGIAIVRLAQGTEVIRISEGRVLERQRFRPCIPVPPVSNCFNIEDPLTSAAEHASDAFEPDLCSVTRYAIRRRRIRRVAVALASAALVCTVLAACANYWGLKHQLAAVRQHRSLLAPKVAAAMRARDSLATLSGDLSIVHDLERSTVRWSTVIADLADYLPRDAYVTELHGEGDSVVVQGIASQARSVFQAMQQMPHTTGLRAAAPIRQDVASDGSVREQFALGVRLAELP
jgi:Tfp pilus assembly protein PilN